MSEKANKKLLSIARTGPGNGDPRHPGYLEMLLEIIKVGGYIKLRNQDKAGCPGVLNDGKKHIKAECLPPRGRK